MREEQNLIRASVAGDCRAFERLVEKYQSLICAITFSATGRVDTSEELAQETFLQAWKNLFQLKDIDKFRSWLCSITRNLIQTHYRQKHASKVAVCDTDTLEILATQACPSSAEIAISREEEMILSHALMQLPEEYREPLVLFYRQHQSTKEVAQSMDMNEATVRTRLSRGRQMLKDKVSVMIEQTLEKTGPGKQFTKAVMVSIGAGLAAGTAATAAGTAAGSLAAGGATTAATGILAATGIKIAAIAAALIIGAGAVVYHYWNPANSAESVMQTAVIEPAQEQDRQEMTSSNSLALVHAENAVAQEVALENKAQDVPVQISSVSVPEAVPQPVSAHPDWPKLNEPVQQMMTSMSHTAVVYENEAKATPQPVPNPVNFEEKVWIKLPNQYRYETPASIDIENGTEKIHIDKIKKTIQHGRPSADNLHFSENRLFALATLFRHTPNPENEPNIPQWYDVRQIGAQNNGEILIYQLIPLSEQAETDYDIHAFVDAATLLPEKIMCIRTDPNQSSEENSEIAVFDFAPIPDSLFTYQPQANDTQLAAKEPAGFTGYVVDLLNQPVAGTDVFIYYNPLWDMEYLKGTTDSAGRFEIRIPDRFPHNTSYMNLPVYFWATLPGRQDFSAWTVLYDPSHTVRGFDPNLLPGFGGNIVSERTSVTGTRTVNGVTSTYQTYSSSMKEPVVKDIVLVMQPTGTIHGYVTDTAGNNISGARLDCRYEFRKKDTLIPFYSSNFKWTFSAESDANGYYVFRGLPSLWKDCIFSITVSAPGYAGENKTITLDEPLSILDYDMSLNLQQITIRGTLKDNLNTPLADRSITLSAPGINLKDSSAQTDPNGNFAFRGCPDIPGLHITAQLSWFNAYNINNQPEKYDAMLYYPEVEVDIPYVPGLKDYVVEMTAIRPETEIEVTVVDSAGQTVPQIKVQLDNNQNSIKYEWKRDKLQKRTDQKGIVNFTNVPEAEKLNVTVKPAETFTLEMVRVFGKSREMDRLNKMDQTYESKYHSIEIPVEFMPGQKKYKITVVIPTQEEYNQQKESAPVESLPHNP